MTKASEEAVPWWSRRAAAATIIVMLLAALAALWGRRQWRQAHEFLKQAMIIYGVDESAGEKLVGSLRGADAKQLNHDTWSVFRRTPVPDDEALHKLLSFVTASPGWKLYKRYHNLSLPR